MRWMGIVAAGLMFGVLLLGVGLFSGCSEDTQSFMQIEQRSVGVAVFDDLLMEGGDEFRSSFNIDGEMTSPEITATWTVLNREIFIDMYVISDASYDPELSVLEQTNVFWTSVPEIGPEFGPRRSNSIILHPCEYNDADPPACRPEGRWWILFHNPQLRSPANRSTVSATVNLRFFQ